MLTQTLPLPVAVSRSPAQRIADALRDAWLGWRRRRNARLTMDALLTLDDHTLRDIGASAELRAHAEAQQGGPYRRMAGLLG